MPSHVIRKSGLSMRASYWGDEFDTREKTVTRLIELGHIKPGDSQYQKRLDPKRNKPKTKEPTEA